jgi:DNA invertase Pin-like site-specific DNA recombinase
VGLHSLGEGIDTSTAGGRLVFDIFGALAELERSLIRERTMAGLARARGRRGGRPSKLTPERLEMMRTMHASRQYTISDISEAVGLSRAARVARR